MIDANRFWASVLAQDAQAMAGYFTRGAYVNWHNTNEHFTAEEFIRANCEYPGNWAGEVERIVYRDDLLITVTHVYSRDRKLSFHVTSFIRLQDDKIAAMDEYWGDDGQPPQWRKAMGLGTAIR